MNKLSLMFCVLVCFGFLSCKSKQNTESLVSIEKEKFNNETFNPFFKAIGTEPFWNVQIDQNFLVYNTPDQESEVFLLKDVLNNNEEVSQTITANNQGKELKLVITKGSCSDGMSDQTFTHKVALAINGKNVAISQNGCGRFTIEKQLIGKWELFYFNEEEIASNKFLKTPYITFNEDNFNISGNSSCNGFNGLVTIDESSIKFSKLAVTKMMCVHENMEQVFLSEIARITNYKVIDGQLELFADNVLKMKLKKLE